MGKKVNSSTIKREDQGLEHEVNSHILKYNPLSETLFTAFLHKEYSTVDELLRFKPESVSSINHHNETLLNLCALKNDIELTKILLQYNPGYEDINKSLILAQAAGHLELAKLLMAKKPRPWDAFFTPGLAIAVIAVCAIFLFPFVQDLVLIQNLGSRFPQATFLLILVGTILVVPDRIVGEPILNYSIFTFFILFAITIEIYDLYRNIFFITDLLLWGGTFVLLQKMSSLR
ncbi:hypothetical protein ACFL35_21955 [Candidatus Riflebacteria bacterium]